MKTRVAQRAKRTEENKAEGRSAICAKMDVG